MTGIGGFNRFARRKADAPITAPAPAPAAATNEGEQPNNDFAAFGGGGGMDSFDNVGMFGGSFDMSFEADKTSYDYNVSDFEGFGVPEKPEESGNAVPGSNDTTAAVNGTVAPTQSTIPTQESTGTPVMTNKTNAGPSQFRANQGGTNPAPSLTSPPRPKTAAPPQQQQGAKSSGLSMFSRKHAASSQEPNTMEKAAQVDCRITANNGQSLKPTGVSTSTAPTAAIVEGAANNSITTPVSAFTRVLPPPSIAPSKPLQTQRGMAIPSVTPKGASNPAVFLPPLSENQNEDFATPAPGTVDTDSSIIQKTGNVTTTFVTPESNVGTTTTLQDTTMDTSFLGDLDDTMYDGKEADGFDDLLSMFLTDLRSTTDLDLHDQAELLDLEVDLSQAFAATLHDRSSAMDLFDGIEDIHHQADDLMAVMDDF